MVKFVKSHFRSFDMNSLQTNIPLYSVSGHRQYQKLSQLHDLLHETKSDMSKLAHEVSLLEKHLIWAMFYNWRHSELDLLSSNSTSLDITIEEL